MIKTVCNIIGLLMSWIYGFFSCKILDMIKPKRVSFLSVLRMPTNEGIYRFVVTILLYAILLILLRRMAIAKEKNGKRLIIGNIISYVLGLSLFIFVSAPFMSGTDCA